MTVVSGVPGDRFIYETCDRCERRSAVSFSVDDDVWVRVISGKYYRVCTTCFDEMADEADVPYVFREVHITSWNQGWNDEWPHLDIPCAECAGRRSREQFAERKRAADNGLTS